MNGSNVLLEPVTSRHIRPFYPPSARVYSTSTPHTFLTNSLLNFSLPGLPTTTLAPLLRLLTSASSRLASPSARCASTSSMSNASMAAVRRVRPVRDVREVLEREEARRSRTSMPLVMAPTLRAL